MVLLPLTTTVCILTVDVGEFLAVLSMQTKQCVQRIMKPIYLLAKEFVDTGRRGRWRAEDSNKFW
jgi:hypothetical protein